MMDVDMIPVGRSVDIELGSEVITVDLDSLDPNPEDVMGLLKDGQCKAWIWTKLAGEYWRRGFLDAAETIALAAVESFTLNGSTSQLPPIYSLLANLQIAHSRKAPKIILPDACQDNLTREKPKESFYGEAAQYINAAGKAFVDSGEPATGELFSLTRGIHQLATRSMDDAMASFESVLAEKPTNLAALIGKARILYAKGAFLHALKLFQTVLQLSPNCQPDPRVAIGLCLWAMDLKPKAKLAWERSLEVNPNDSSALLLLGLESINASKNENQPDEDRTQAYLTGTKYVERAFNSNQKNASAANALCELFLRKGNHARALKLAERTIQFADTKTVLTEGYIRAGRVSHANGSIEHATKYYSSAATSQSHHVLAAIGVAQMHIHNDAIAAAIHALDTLLQPPNAQRSLEATVMLASLRAHPRAGISDSELAAERIRARELFDRVGKDVELDNVRANGASSSSRTSRTIGEDISMHAEIAQLWQEENLQRMGKALNEALRISEATGKVDPRILNNLGALAHLEGDFVEGRALYERALGSVAALGSDVGEGMSTSILYNLARVLEDAGEDDRANEAYVKLLSRHPEYVDAKVRQAQMLARLNRNTEAHDLLKQSLSSQGGNLNLRAFYTHFLIQTNLPKPAKDFVFGTLKDHDKHDVYSLCAAGWIMYHQSRESRETSSKGVEERRKGFQRSAEFYEKALQLDPTCAFAAQGLAIITAEDALGSLSNPGAHIDDAQRNKNAREALDVFAKVRESINEGSVYANMGHCYHSREEYDRAIESYETASVRFFGGHDVSVLLCLCRSWWAKANKEQSFVSMKTALRYAQMALHIQPNDKAIVYNISMIQQKAAEMLFAAPAAKRSLKDLQWAIDQAGHAQKLFGSLASDRSSAVPYSREIADQRRKYGERMLRKAEEHVASQREFEDTAQARLGAARQKRQQERDRVEAAERGRLDALKRDADALTAQRQRQIEEAQGWSREAAAREDVSDDDEGKKRGKKGPRKSKADKESGDEAAPKKKRNVRGRLKKNADRDDQEDEALFSDAEEKPKKRAKKTQIKDEDEDDDEPMPAARKKQVKKSKEVLTDTEPEDDD